MSHQCLKVFAIGPTAVYLHAPVPVQPEVLDSMEELLQEMLDGTAPARMCRPNAPLLPRAYLDPISRPGVHFHPLPRLATIARIVIATDAGTPSAKEPKAARGVEAIPDEGPGMTAAGVSQNAQGGYAAASIQAPATAQEGEAVALLRHIISVSWVGDIVWVVVDSEAAA